MGAPIGNQNAKKLRTEELQRTAYQSYCAHLAKGKSKRSWVFEHPEVSLTSETMEIYLKDRTAFDPFLKKIAEAKGFAIWEEIVEQSAKGENNANTASLQMVMRNKFGWDRDLDETKEQKQKELDYLAQAVDSLREVVKKSA